MVLQPFEFVVCSEVQKFDDLTLTDFFAGYMVYAAILQRPTLPSQELYTRIVHLSSNVSVSLLGVRSEIFT